MRRIPVTILAGYLGAGKTTILNHVLAERHDERIAVLVNDFGQVNVDAALIRSRTRSGGAAVLELSNGCVCCTIGDDLGETLSAIAAWDAPPERLLLECSGVAEPGRIAMTVGHWPGFELDAIIVAADAETVRARASDKYVGALVRSQLCVADIVALTRADLVGNGEVAAVEAWLRGVDPAARIVSAPGGRLPAALMMGARLSDGPKKDAPMGRAASGRSAEDGGHAHPAFATVTWRPEGPVDVDRLGLILASLPAQVHRAKGFVTDARTGAGTAVQVVGARASLVPGRAATGGQDAGGLVIIAVGSGREEALAGTLARLDECVSPMVGA